MTTCRVDAVVRAVLSAEELAVIDYDREGIAMVRLATPGNPDSDGVLSVFTIRNGNDGCRFLGASRVSITPDVVYASAIRDGVDGRLGQATLNIFHRFIPETLLVGLAGRPLGTLVHHPALADPRLIVIDAWYEAPGDLPPAPLVPTITVLLPQLVQEIALTASASPSYLRPRCECRFRRKDDA